MFLSESLGRTRRRATKLKLVRQESDWSSQGATKTSGKPLKQPVEAGIIGLESVSELKLELVTRIGFQIERSCPDVGDLRGPGAFDGKIL